ncbi:MAG: helicase-related protein, partial [Aggregatilineales bacterium]
KLVVRHIERRGGAILGDVVGLGKTLMAMAVAAVFHRRGLEILIVCPKNLVGMWENYLYRFQLPGKVIALSVLQRELQGLPRYRLLIVDESHNFRNPEGKRYAALRDYIQKNECRCLLLSATPYNKSYGDLAAQLGLFIDDDADIGVRPERYIKALGGESMALAKHQGRLSSLAAFRASSEADDWRELMRLYLVRRTRHFILENYAETDPSKRRRYLERHDGERFYFPVRCPRTITFESGGDDPYAQLYSDEVVAAIESLHLPRYGLGQYVIAERHKSAPEKDRAILADLSKAGKRLMGFCRTNLFKRLESSGESFLRSVRRHVLRNYVFLYALEKGSPLPIGTLDALAFDSRSEDRDEALLSAASDDESEENVAALDDSALLKGDQDYRQQAQQVYELLQRTKRFKWIEPRYFKESLAAHLRADCEQLSDILRRCGPWQAERDTKLKALLKLIEANRGQKMLIFSQFADTVEYLIDQLKRHGVRRAERVTGESEDPTAIIRRFSPISNGADIPPESQIDILIATDVLSEGQNLQDAAIVVNFDLPWAIIRLVQRAGRVDRIGQRAEAIDCYSFMP